MIHRISNGGVPGPKIESIVGRSNAKLRFPADTHLQHSSFHQYCSVYVVQSERSVFECVLIRVP